MKTQESTDWREFDSLYEELDYPVCCTSKDCACNKETLLENIKHWISSHTQKVRQEERRNLLKELLPIIQEDIDFGAKNQQIVSTKAQARVLVLLSALSQEQ